MELFFFGLIIGILTREIKTTSIETLEQVKEKVKKLPDKTSFYEPVTPKEQFEGAKSIDDLLT